MEAAINGIEAISIRQYGNESGDDTDHQARETPAAVGMCHPYHASISQGMEAPVPQVNKLFWYVKQRRFIYMVDIFHFEQQLCTEAISITAYCVF